jgi:tripartite-type tricarboxylate transporter receptor subunit TctC
MHPNRRKTLTLALATALPWASMAQERFPSRPVTLVVPQAAGGANDAIARILAQRLTEQTGQQFVVENRAGAGGNVGTAAVAKAKNDGYTLMLTTNSAQVINPWLYKNTGFDPVKDFDPVAMLATAGYVLVANNNFPARNVSELVAAAKAQPGKITIASAGNGTLNHLIGEMLQRATGIEMTHVPYRGAAAAVTDLVAGQVQVSVQSLPSSISFIRSGRLKVLGTVNESRVAALPDVPTIGETIRGFGSTPWYAVFAPTGAPKPAITWLHAEIAKALDAPEVKEKLGGVGCEPFKGTPEQLAATVRDELPKWQRLVKESGATLD